MDRMRADVEVIDGCLTVLDNPKPVEVANMRFRPENVTMIFDPRQRVIGEHKITRSRRYHPFDWDGSFPETELAPLRTTKTIPRDRKG